MDIMAFRGKLIVILPFTGSFILYEKKNPTPKKELGFQISAS
jgi:hypothetical protein